MIIDGVEIKTVGYGTHFGKVFIELNGKSVANPMPSNKAQVISGWLNSILSLEKGYGVFGKEEDNQLPW